MTIHEHLMQTRAICDAATPGEWVSEGEGDVVSESGIQIADFVPWECDRTFIAHARTALPRFAKALEVAVMGIDGEIGAASCCGRTTQYARLHKLRAEIQAALEGR